MDAAQRTLVLTTTRAGGGEQIIENEGGNLDAGDWEINFIFGGHAVAHMCGIAAIRF